MKRNKFKKFAQSAFVAAQGSAFLGALLVPEYVWFCVLGAVLCAAWSVWQTSECAAEPL